jgi:hypothetical protein
MEHWQYLAARLPLLPNTKKLGTTDAVAEFLQAKLFEGMQDDRPLPGLQGQKAEKVTPTVDSIISTSP